MTNAFTFAAGTRICALLAASLLVLEPCAPLHAQAVAAPPRGLQIMILDGEGTLNNIQQRTAREPIVQVQDENHKPVAGALILFAIHSGDGGAGGAFANGATSLSVTTGADGTAKATGLLANSTKGSWQVSVNASYGTLTASTVINEINYNPAPPSSSVTAPVPVKSIGLHWPPSKITLTLGGVGIAVVVGVLAYHFASENNPTKITAGNPGVGPPTSAATAGIRIRF
jgi:hypothetical protein